MIKKISCSSAIDVAEALADVVGVMCDVDYVLSDKRCRHLTRLELLKRAAALRKVDRAEGSLSSQLLDFIASYQDGAKLKPKLRVVSKPAEHRE